MIDKTRAYHGSIHHHSHIVTPRAEIFGPTNSRDRLKQMTLKTGYKKCDESISSTDSSPKVVQGGGGDGRRGGGGGWMGASLTQGPPTLDDYFPNYACEQQNGCPSF